MVKMLFMQRLHKFVMDYIEKDENNFDKLKSL